MTSKNSRRNLTPQRILAVIIIGAIAGFLAGLFGVGGGLIIVPALMIILDMPQRRAAATSLSAIIITAAAGSVSYATQGQLSVPAMVCVSIGALGGAQLGTWLLRILPERVLPWIFVVFVTGIITIQQFQLPSRDTEIVITLTSGIAMLAVGVVSGTFAGLVGVGGGGIIVPGLELIGAGDLIARGTSLLAMIPTALSGTITSFRHNLVDLPVGLIIGCAAVSSTPLGVWAAASISPQTGNYLFNLFLIVVCISTVFKARARQRKEEKNGLDSGK
ncbi:sulfite exporter TauE/SafE family protein [Arcanobacterium buesumense]|uniref:Probable membrane transporter protein n=1 Tax=Arcanobacterium buesumense TaxID=2722751 RepID=A0A6H2EJH4_9ACTO|nr:sulfite exporter TauE/SafE family protein [Arcanobacterium buesumense]QJC21718.1 sulfite exporter TauE/SafE family protein [Arcanobacterium buesumense]